MKQEDVLTEQFIRDMSDQAINQQMDYDSEMYKYFQNLVKTEGIPAKIKQRFWAFSDKEAVLTNMRVDEIRRVLMDFDINYLMYLMSRDESDFNFEEMLEIEQGKSHLNIRLHRSKDGFERRMESTQIREMTVSRQGGKEGVLSSFFGLFKRRRE